MFGPFGRGSAQVLQRAEGLGLLVAFETLQPLFALLPVGAEVVGGVRFATLEGTLMILMTLMLWLGRTGRRRGRTAAQVAHLEPEDRKQLAWFMYNNVKSQLKTRKRVENIIN